MKIPKFISNWFEDTLYWLKTGDSTLRDVNGNKTHVYIDGFGGSYVSPDYFWKPEVRNYFSKNSTMNYRLQPNVNSLLGGYQKELDVLENDKRISELTEKAIKIRGSREMSVQQLNYRAKIEMIADSTDLEELKDLLFEKHCSLLEEKTERAKQQYLARHLSGAFYNYLVNDYERENTY